MVDTYDPICVAIATEKDIKDILVDVSTEYIAFPPLAYRNIDKNTWEVVSYEPVSDYTKHWESMEEYLKKQNQNKGFTGFDLIITKKSISETLKEFKLNVIKIYPD